MNNNNSYNQAFNQHYINPQQDQLKQSEIIRYQQEQNKEVSNAAKAVHDLCVAYKKLDPQHKRQVILFALDEIFNESVCE